MRILTRYFLWMSMSIGFIACTNNDIVDELTGTQDADSYLEEITVSLPELQEEDSADTRSTFTMTSSSFDAVWAEGDTLGIFPSVGGQVEFPLTDFGGKSAMFTGGGWALKTSYTYAAYYPFSKNNVHKTNKTIPLDYTGQTQNGSGSYAHLGVYDFLGASSVTPTGGGVNLALERLGAIIWLKITVPATETYTKVELVTDGNLFVTKATLDISGASPVTTPVETSNTISLDLKNMKAITKGKVLNVYMMAYPLDDVGGVTPTVRLYGKNLHYEGKVPTLMKLEKNKRYPREIKDMTAFSLTNKNLISSAEMYNADVTFTKESDGTVSLMNADNLEMLDKVTVINVPDLNDPTVCDEIYLFKNLMYLYCNGNKLTALDVSKNTALEHLYCYNNKLTALDVSKNTKLTALNCSNNKLNTLDVSKNTKLTNLYCTDNKLTTLDLSKNTVLTYLNCNDNQLTALNVSKNTALTALECNNNELTTLNVTKNTKLTDLNCDDNELATLNVSKNTVLEYLMCDNNELSTLDVSKNTVLKTLTCNNNFLTTLDLSRNTELTYLGCYQNVMSSLNITACTSLTKSSTYCGIQYSNAKKIGLQYLTLTARSADETSLPNTYYNRYVTVVNE